MKDLKVFISYRRSDTQHVAGRLGDRVSQRFTLFMDIDDIPIGEDFTTVVRRAVNESDVLLVLIGPQFLAVDQEGHRRLDRPGDWVAEEIAAGLNRDITVVPVLVDGATMPDDDELPTPLKPLRHRQALSLSHATFNADAERLIDALIRIEGGRHREADRGPAELINDPEYAWATAAEFNQRWSEAIELFTALDHRYPDDDRVRRGLRTADLQLESRAAEQAGHWDEAVTCLTELATLSATDPRIGQRLAAARSQRHVEDLSGQLRALYAAKEWAGVGVISRQIRTLDPARADPDGLATAAAVKVKQRIQEAYLTGLRALDVGECQVALAQFEEIQRDSPGYGRSADLVKLARFRLQSVAGAGDEPSIVPLSGAEPMARPLPMRQLRAVERRARRAAALLGSRPWADGRLRPAALAATSTIVALGEVSVICSRLIGWAYFLTVLATYLMLAILLRDARRLDPPSASVLRRTGVVIMVVGTVASFIVVSIAINLLHGVQAVGALATVTALALVLAAFGYRRLRRRLGPAATWASLLFVLITQTCVLFVAMTH